MNIMYCKLVRARDNTEMLQESGWAAQVRGEAALGESFCLLQDEDGNAKEKVLMDSDSMSRAVHSEAITWMGNADGTYSIYPADVKVYEASDGTFWCRDDQTDAFFTF